MGFRLPRASRDQTEPRAAFTTDFLSKPVSIQPPCSYSELTTQPEPTCCAVPDGDLDTASSETPAHLRKTTARSLPSDSAAQDPSILSFPVRATLSCCVPRVRRAYVRGHSNSTTQHHRLGCNCALLLQANHPECLL